MIAPSDENNCGRLWTGLSFHTTGLKTKGQINTTVDVVCRVPLTVFTIKARWALHHALAPVDDEALQVRQVDLGAHF